MIPSASRFPRLIRAVRASLWFYICHPYMLDPFRPRDDSPARYGAHTSLPNFIFLLLPAFAPLFFSGRFPAYKTKSVSISAGRSFVGKSFFVCVEDCRPCPSKLHSRTNIDSDLDVCVIYIFYECLSALSFFFYSVLLEKWDLFIFINLSVLIYNGEDALKLPFLI